MLKTDMKIEWVTWVRKGTVLSIEGIMVATDMVTTTAFALVVGIIGGRRRSKEGTIKGGTTTHPSKDTLLTEQGNIIFPSDLSQWYWSRFTDMDKICIFLER